MGIIWTIIIGFVAGVIAKFLLPGENEPRFHPHNTARCRRRVRRHVPWPSPWMVSAR
jgi:hypothetical protein